MDFIYQKCVIAFEESKSSKFARYAFAKLAYKEGYTYNQIAQYLNLGNHSSAIYYVRRADRLIERKNDGFLTGWNKLGQIDTRLDQAINLATSNIIDHIGKEKDPQKRFEFIRFTILGFAGLSSSFQHRSNDVSTSFKRC